MTEHPDGEMRYDPATGSVRIPAHWSPRPGDIPADQLTALQIGAMDVADGIRVGYRVGWHAASGHEVTVDDAGRVQIGARAEPARDRQALADWLLARWLKAADTEPEIEAPVEGYCDAIAGWLIEAGRLAVRFETPDPLTVAVLDAAIVWRQGTGDSGEPLAQDERDLAAVVDAMLDARHTVRDELTVTVPREMLEPTPVDPLDVVHAALRETVHQSLTDMHPAVTRYLDDLIADQSARDPEFARGVRDTEAALAVTPAADLADEATHERVARAIRPELDANGAIGLAHRIAGLAVAAYRAGPTDDIGQRAVQLMERLHAGLTERAVPHDGPDYADAVTRVLAHVDRLDTALTEATRATLDDELDDESLQELRLGVLPVAAEIAAGAVDDADAPLLVRDQEQTVISTADRLVEWDPDATPTDGGTA